MNYVFRPGSLCRTFQDLALATWEARRRSLLTGISKSEESITADNLIALNYRHPDAIWAVDFTKQFESRVTGSDWEWWFIQDGLNFGAAVQAKSLNRKLVYEHIDHVSEKNGPQINKLIDYAKRQNITPLYCFYNWWSPSDVSFPWPCKSYGQNDQLLGCTLADASVVYRLHRSQRYGLVDLMPYMMPWHCIACCRGYVGSHPDGPGARSLGIAKHLRDRAHEVDIILEESDDKLEGLRPPDFHPELPYRIQVVREYLLGGREMPEGLVADLFGPELPSGVVIVGT